ncbi:DegV family protein [Brevibacterium litoralis]|uniref:DegV family protein n=1 Tax=Brevibacterium litoralis TaxID=3138935 RepID=UPI0032EAC05C
MNTVDTAPPSAAPAAQVPSHADRGEARAAVGVVVDSTAMIRGTAAAALSARLEGRFAVVDLHVEVDPDPAAEAPSTPDAPVTSAEGGDDAGDAGADAESAGDPVSLPDSAWDAATLCRAMDAGRGVRTSMPSSADFVHAIRSVLDAGADQVVVLTLSAELSGTHGSAIAAAGGVREVAPVHVVDSRTTSAVLAAATRAAVTRAEAGGSIDQVVRAAQDVLDTGSAIAFVPADLVHLQRGGRIGAAASLLGKALSIVPVLTLESGAVATVGTVRTRKRAVTRLARTVVQRAVEIREDRASQDGADGTDVEHGSDVGTFDGRTPWTPAFVLVHSEDVPAPGEEPVADVPALDMALRQEAVAAGLVGEPTELVVHEDVLSTVITAHVGPGALGVAVVPAEYTAG